VSGQYPEILYLRPGITGQASLVFRDEERLLGQVREEKLGDFYVSTLLPEKVRLDLEYASSATLLSDWRLICSTALSMWRPAERTPLVSLP